MRLRQALQEDLWRQLRQRILQETGSFLSEALERPEMGVSIPICVVGRASFSETFSQEFWRQVLGE